MEEYVDKKGYLWIKNMEVYVRVLKARKVYGRVDVLVVPVMGSGMEWVNEARVRWEVEG